MRRLKDGTEVLLMVWDYLVFFNTCDRWSTIEYEFHTRNLEELDKEQFYKLFELATITQLKT